MARKKREARHCGLHEKLVMLNFIVVAERKSQTGIAVFKRTDGCPEVRPKSLAYSRNARTYSNWPKRKNALSALLSCHS